MLGGVNNLYLQSLDWGWQIDLEGVRYALDDLYDRYRLPRVVVENGLGAKDETEADGSISDDSCINYLRQHIEQMKAFDALVSKSMNKMSAYKDHTAMGRKSEQMRPCSAGL